MVGISVVIPVYNAGAFINKCLDAIIAQEGGTSYEIILVDDGSTDNSVEVIRQYQESKELKRVRRTDFVDATNECRTVESA